jgi:sialic acid synthase SpsE
LRHIAGFNKPIILSTGLSTLAEVKESVRAIKNTGNKKIILLQCTANYPPLPQDVNLKVLDTLRRECSCLVGYSDHLGWAEGAVAAISRGACTYEVHFTLDRRMAGPDHRSSLEPQELKNIISSIRLAERLLGSAEKKVTASEKETRLRLRKSIVATRDIPAGDTLTLSNIGIKRPGTGLAPEYFNMLLGKLAKRDISKDELILLRDISKKEKLCG